MRRGFKTECERQAIHWREQLKLLRHDPLPAERLADHLEIDVLNPRQIPGFSASEVDLLLVKDANSWSAVTLCADSVTVIVHNSTNSPARQEADLMHELSHVILEHKPIRFVELPGFPFPLREFRKDDEEEAAWLGGCLQIPRAALEWSLKRRMTPQQIADYFGASLDMANYRINTTGVKRQFRS